MNKSEAEVTRAYFNTLFKNERQTKKESNRMFKAKVVECYDNLYYLALYVNGIFISHCKELQEIADCVTQVTTALRYQTLVDFVKD